MARSNPYIHKLRNPNWTVLAVGEGETEKAFLQFLKGKLNKRDDGITIRVNYAGGGGPECVIDHAIKMSPKNYDCAFVLLDKDLRCRENYFKKARVYRLELIWCIPCIEGLFLKILKPTFDPATKSTDACKQFFEGTYLNDDDKLVPIKYESIFDYDLLERRRMEVRELGTLVRLMTEKRK